MAEQENKPAETTGKEVSEPKSGQFLSAFDEFDQWLDEMRRNWVSPLLFGRPWPETAGSVFGGRIPRVDVIDRETEICVKAELPGVSKEDLDISLQESTLTIKATTKREETEEKGQYQRRETSRGEFQRTLRLPGPVLSDQAKATFKDGVLELVLPKAPGFQRQSIKVE
jgi:HSP20 family protein